MELSLKRGPSLQGATLGDLCADGVWQCFTLEDVVREPDVHAFDSGFRTTAGHAEWVASWKIPKVTAIPRGRFRVTITFSLHFGRDLPLINGVPGFDGVRMHSGNKAADTEGCILVGQTKEANLLYKSRLAFDSLYAKIQAALQGGGECFITVS